MAQTQKKSLWKNAIIGVVISVVSISVIIALFRGKTDFSVLLRIPIKYLLTILSLIIATWLLDAFRTWCLLRASEIKHVGIISLLENSVLTMFFNAITPFAAGGQPFQVYYLTKLEIGVDISSAVVVSKFIVGQMVLMALAWMGLILYGNLIMRVSFIGHAVIIGFLMTTFFVVVLILFGFSKSVARTIVTGVLKLGKVFKLIKKERFDKINENFQEKAKEFNNSVLYLAMNKKWLSIHFLLAAVQWILCLYIPYYIFQIISNTLSSKVLEITAIQTIALLSVLFTVIYYIPTPGGSGSIETGFYLFFRGLIATNTLILSTVVWRMYTYYLILVVGAFLFIYITKKHVRSYQRE